MSRIGRNEKRHRNDKNKLHDPFVSYWKDKRGSMSNIGNQVLILVECDVQPAHQKRQFCCVDFWRSFPSSMLHAHGQTSLSVAILISDDWRRDDGIAVRVNSRAACCPSQFNQIDSQSAWREESVAFALNTRDLVHSIYKYIYKIYSLGTSKSDGKINL